MSKFRVNSFDQDPFVFSPDIEGLFEEWGKASSLMMPCPSYMESVGWRIAEYLENIFPNVQIVKESDVKNKLRTLCSNVPSPIIAVDRTYSINGVLSDKIDYLDITKAVGLDYKTIGLIHYNRDISKKDQTVGIFADAAREIALAHKGQKIALLDDIVFFGTTMLNIRDVLSEYDVSIECVIAGISTGAAKENLSTANINLVSAYHFEHVFNEVCGRDLVVGTPNGGRTVLVVDEVHNHKTVKKAPFIEPFGTTRWATIPPKHAQNFSNAMLDISIDLWSEIERLNARKISSEELRNPILNLNNVNSIVEALKEIRHKNTKCCL
ncbi:MAG: hypothetical protein FWF24_02745 [Alphaproteobacteria bacterium]|nr:hypothetical protein [Alphaproteobacteria bacterium]